MKILWSAAIAVLLSTASQAQVKVVILSADEAKTAKRLQEESEELQKRIIAFNAAIVIKYLTVPITDPNPEFEKDLERRGMRDLKAGWENGFEYSDDWKTIVGKQARPSPCGSPPYWYLNWEGNHAPAIITKPSAVRSDISRTRISDDCCLSCVP